MEHLTLISLDHCQSIVLPTILFATLFVAPSVWHRIWLSADFMSRNGVHCVPFLLPVTSVCVAQARPCLSTLTPFFHHFCAYNFCDPEGQVTRFPHPILSPLSRQRTTGWSMHQKFKIFGLVLM